MRPHYLDPKTISLSPGHKSKKVINNRRVPKFAGKGKPALIEEAKYSTQTCASTVALAMAICFPRHSWLSDKQLLILLIHLKPHESQDVTGRVLRRLDGGFLIVISHDFRSETRDWEQRFRSLALCPDHLLGRARGGARCPATIESLISDLGFPDPPGSGL